MILIRVLKEIILSTNLSRTNLCGVLCQLALSAVVHLTRRLMTLSSVEFDEYDENYFPLVLRCHIGGT
jgi:hypothetical protein